MVSKLTRDDGNRNTALSVIRQRLLDNPEARLTAEEAGLVLDWAQTCEDATQRASLLEIFDLAGGLDQIRNMMGPGH